MPISVDRLVVRHSKTVPDRHRQGDTYTGILASLNEQSPGFLLLCQVKMMSSNNPKLLFAISGLLTTAFVNAQDSSCQNRQEFKTVNSTGQHSFTWNSSYASDDPWYVSVLIGSQGTDVTGKTYISAPENVSNGTGICSYAYNNINATLESGKDNSCSGVISSACIDHLTKALSSNTANLCPDSDTGSTSDAFKQACPMLEGGSRSTLPPLSLHMSPLCSFFSIFLHRTNNL